MKTTPKCPTDLINHPEPRRFWKRFSSPVAGILLFLFAVTKSHATFYVSNLDNVFSGGGIGDIHGLFQGGAYYGTDTAHFDTGTGNYTLNFITLEFYSGSQYVTAQLLQNGNILATLGNPQVNAKQTQWPAYTKFINFYPTTPVQLSPLASYDILLSNPAGSGGDAALLFSLSSAFASSAGWTMSPTTSGNPSAFGQYLKLAVDATPVPEPSATILLIGATAISFIIRGRRKSG
jgi:hypothetical protein